MTPERWKQINRIFSSAIELRPEDRTKFLDQACSNDSELRLEVESLIAAHEKDGSFIVDSGSKAMGGLLKELVEDPLVELKAGQTVAGYQITRFLNSGGMGEVYLAYDPRLGRNVALKLLPSMVTTDADRLRRFEQEARAASALNHPNIITIYEIQKVDSTLVIAAEFIEGTTLRERLSSGALELKEALNISIQVADALSAAHQAGIIHRDIKPENIMIRPDGYVKVLDFGLAKLIETKPLNVTAEAPTRKLETRSGVIMGTVGYMSPEQARGLDIDMRTDIFSLGAVVYEMVGGLKPFRGGTASDVFAAVLNVEPTPLSHLAPDTPPELVRIVTKALKKDRDERYQNVKDLLLDLKSLKEEVEFKAKFDRSVASNATSNRAVSTSQVGATHSNAKTPAVSQPFRVDFRRHKKTTITIGLLLLAAVVAAVTIYKSVNQATPQTKPTPKPDNITQVTFSTGLDGYPSLSPDGKSIAYSSDQNGKFEVYVKQLAPGGGELQLTNDGQQNFQPAWSPDGQRIAYLSKGRGGIWFVSALGGTPRRLTEFGAKPAWSFDGSEIVFQSKAAGDINQSTALAPSTIWIVSSQGGEPRQLTQPGNPRGGHSSPSWSPDGRRIVFDCSDYIVQSVWILDLATQTTKRLDDGINPFFDPDGKHVYYLRAGLARLEVSPSGEPIGERQIVIQPSAGAMQSPSLSADGKKIVYTASRISSYLWSVPLSPGTATAVGPPEPFSKDTSFRTNLARFSPDGKRVAMTRWRPGFSADIWVGDGEGKNLTQLTNNVTTDSQPSWFPDGDRLAFLSDREKPGESFAVWSISTTTGKEEKLLDLKPGSQFATLSPDGSQLALHSLENGVVNIWTVSMKTGESKQLTFGTASMAFPCWSPDGRFIAFENQAGENDFLMLIPSSGGEVKQLTLGEGKSWPHSWSADGDKIAFAGFRNGVWNIYWYSLSSKTETQLTNNKKLNSFVRYPAWSPLGNQIVYEYAETTGNVWLAEFK